MPSIITRVPLTAARTLYWTIYTDVAVGTPPDVAFTGLRARPTSASTWYSSEWDAPDDLVGDQHVRRLRRLVAGPNGPTNGSPAILPRGDYRTWVRVTTSTEQVIFPGDRLLSVK